MRKKEKGHIRYNLQELRTVRVLHGALAGLKDMLWVMVISKGSQDALRGTLKGSQRNLRGITRALDGLLDVFLKIPSCFPLDN